MPPENYRNPGIAFSGDQAPGSEKKQVKNPDGRIDPTPTLTGISRLISYITHPILIPAVAVALLIFGRTIMSPVPYNVKWFLMGMVTVTTVLIPGGLIAILTIFRVLPEFRSQVLKNRILPMVFVAFSFIACAFMLKDFMLAYLIRKYLLTALCCVALAAAVTLFWNISLYMMALGSLATVLIIMNYSGFGQFSWGIIILLIVTGLTASARLYLGKHDPGQIYIGFLCGVVSAVAGMLVL